VAGAGAGAGAALLVGAALAGGSALGQSLPTAPGQAGAAASGLAVTGAALADEFDGVGAAGVTTRAEAVGELAQALSVSPHANAASTQNRTERKRMTGQGAS